MRMDGTWYRSRGTVVGFMEKFGSSLNGNKEEALWDGIFMSSVCLTVSSIPLFIYSHKNKKKALQAYVLIDNIRVNLLSEMTRSRPGWDLEFTFEIEGFNQEK